MADQEFLASYAVEIDEAGVARLQSVLEGSRELAEQLSAAFGAATEAIRAFREELGTLPSFASGSGIVTEGLSGFSGLSLGLDTAQVKIATEDLSGFSGLSLGLDTAQARQEVESIIALAKKPVQLSANASGMVSAARSAYSSIRSIFSEPVPLTVSISGTAGTASSAGSDGSSGSDTPVVGGIFRKLSMGGRFSKPTDVQVAEDGDAEYIIPVKKEDRAVPLLRQLLSELSPAARESLSLGDAALPLSGGLAAGNAGATQIIQNNSNVSAPVSIEVHASGANAEQIGQSVYNTAERYLLRTMKGVFS